jgi:hypothetical protein
VTSLSRCTDVLIDKAANIRTMLLGAPLFLAFRSLKGGASVPAAIPYRGSDVLYTIPRPEHVAVVFLLNFEDPTEKNIARIIAQEFVENQPKVGRAPPVSFSVKDPPAVRHSCVLCLSCLCREWLCGCGSLGAVGGRCTSHLCDAWVDRLH